MTIYSEIKDAVATALSELVEIGHIYKSKRFMATDSALYAEYFFDETADLRAIELNNHSTEYRIKSGVAFGNATFTLDYLMSFNQDTDSIDVFDEKCQEIIRRLSSLFSIEAISNKVSINSIQLVYIGESPVCGVLCHRAKIHFNVNIYQH